MARIRPKSLPDYSSNSDRVEASLIMVIVPSPIVLPITDGLTVIDHLQRLVGIDGRRPRSVVIAPGERFGHVWAEYLVPVRWHIYGVGGWNDTFLTVGRPAACRQDTQCHHGEAGQIPHARYLPSSVRRKFLRKEHWLIDAINQVRQRVREFRRKG